jgi:protein-S-isoprenylcysteine O-methyltransferase Ste14
MQQKSKEILGYLINASTIVIYFILLSILEIPPVLTILAPVGWLLLITGATFILLTIATLLRKHTESVISSSVFSIVRHPMYLGSILIYLAMVCFLPHWIMAILIAVNVIYIYWFMVLEEKQDILKYGADYERYMQSVPRANLFSGFIRLLRRKRGAR